MSRPVQLRLSSFSCVLVLGWNFNKHWTALPEFVHLRRVQQAVGLSHRCMIMVLNDAWPGGYWLVLQSVEAQLRRGSVNSRSGKEC